MRQERGLPPASHVVVIDGLEEEAAAWALGGSRGVASGASEQYEVRHGLAAGQGGNNVPVKGGVFRVSRGAMPFMPSQICIPFLLCVFRWWLC